MSCCNINPKQLCKVEVCTGVIDTGLTAASAGTYQIVFNNNGFIYTANEDFEENEPIIFSVVGLNENQEYIAEIIRPDGNKLTIPNPPAADYDSVQFTTYQNFNL